MEAILYQCKQDYYKIKMLTNSIPRITTKEMSGKYIKKGMGRVSNRHHTRKSSTKEDSNRENEQKKKYKTNQKQIINYRNTLFISNYFKCKCITLIN